MCCLDHENPFLKQISMFFMYCFSTSMTSPVSTGKQLVNYAILTILPFSPKNFTKYIQQNNPLSFKTNALLLFKKQDVSRFGEN